LLTELQTTGEIVIVIIIHKLRINKNYFFGGWIFEDIKVPPPYQHIPHPDPLMEENSKSSNLECLTIVEVQVMCKE
jgi:hypothetical protein